MEPDGAAQVAVFVDFENLVIGAVKELPDQANPAPYEALTRLCRGYGNASVRRAYADWANPLFGSHQDDLAMNGVDLIQVARVGIQNKNAADIRMAVDAMETLIVHPEVSVFILVSGDGGGRRATTPVVAGNGSRGRMRLAAGRVVCNHAHGSRLATVLRGRMAHLGRRHGGDLPDVAGARPRGGAAGPGGRADPRRGGPPPGRGGAAADRPRTA